MFIIGDLLLSDREPRLIASDLQIRVGRIRSHDYASSRLISLGGFGLCASSACLPSQPPK